MDWFRRVWRRRVPHVLGVYLATGWAFVEVTAFLVGRYRLTDNLVDIVLAGLLVLVPAVVVLAWNRFGRDEGDRLSRAEAWAVVLNVVVGGGLLWGLFGGAPVGRATTTVEVAGEDGATVQREIPRPDLLRKVMVYNLAADQAAPVEPWQQAALGMALYVDLGQDRFIQPQRPLLPRHVARLRAEGKDTGGAPRRLMAELSRDIEAQFFLAGRMATRPAGLFAEVEVYTVEPSRRVATVSAEGADVFALTDALTPLVRAHLDLAAERASAADDLPVSELLTPSMPAMEAVSRSDIAALVDNDYNTAFDFLERSVEIDPAFAFAGSSLMIGAYSLGQGQRAERGRQAAMRGIDRLSEPGRFAVRAFDAALRGDNDDASRLRRLWVELHPQDPIARETLAAQYLTRRDTLPLALAQYEALRDLGRGFDSALLRIGDLRRALGDPEGAAKAFEAYRALHPDQPRPLRSLAALRLRAGDAAAAEQLLRDALLLPAAGASDHVELAGFLADQGRHDEALAALDAAARTSRTPQDESTLLRGRIEVLAELGRLVEARALIERSLAPLPNAMQPMFRVMLESVLLQVGDDRAAIDRVLAMVDAAFPGDDEVAGAARGQTRWTVLLETGDRDGIVAGRTVLGAAIERHRREDQRYLLQVSDARVAEIDGDHRAAATAYAEALRGARAVVDGYQLVPEGRLLRMLLRAQRNAGLLDDARATASELALLRPGSVLVLLERAKLAQAQDEMPAARELLDRVLAATRGADPGFGPRAEAQALRGALDDPG